MFLLYIGTTLVIGAVIYYILHKSRLSERATCMLCGERLAEIYNEGAYAYDTRALIEKEHKCVNCGGEMELKKK